jgi:hypothetical protein
MLNIHSSASILRTSSILNQTPTECFSRMVDFEKKNSGKINIHTLAAPHYKSEFTLHKKVVKKIARLIRTTTCHVN